MKAKPSRLLLLPVLAAVIFVSGCTGLDPETLAMANPLIQQFLDEHPNAKIVVTHFTAEQAKNMIDQIRSDCDNPYIDEKEFYRVTINDTESNFYAVAWIDWQSKTIQCAIKTGTEGKVIENPKERPGCESHSYYKCDSGNLYWFDSCGNKQDKKEYCQYGCSENKCLGECKSQAEYRCYGDYIYWFDSCGNKQDKKEYCQYGCENGFCRRSPEVRTCEQAGGYCIWPEGYCGDGVCTETERQTKCRVTGTCEGINDTECSAPGKEVCTYACEEDCSQATSSGGSGETATGMIVSTEVTSTGTIRIRYQCRAGYQVSVYFCKEGGICCAPEVTPPETVFCGSSTQGSCASDSECITGGCSGQVCQSVKEEPVVSDCVYKDCYNAEKYGVVCKCVSPSAQVTGAITGTAGRCMWTKADSTPNRRCSTSEDCKATCAYGCVNAEWMVGRGDCEAIPTFGCECVNGACQKREPQCSSEGQFCGGIAAIKCCSGFTCQLDGTYPDAGGECIKIQICKDSDGGWNQYVRGTSATSSGISRTDECAQCTGLCEPGTECQPVYCGAVVEYACKEGEIVRETFQCPYGCQEGACLKESQTCTDSDGGKNYYQIGTATAGGSSLTDHCNEDGTLTEKYCSGSQISAEVYQCQYGCSDGACLQEQKNCTETDGGRYDYYKKGTITTQQGTFNDFCVSPTTLTENYCDYSYHPLYQGRADSYTCPYGCSDGACINQTYILLINEGFEGYSVGMAPSSPWQTLANPGIVTDQMAHSGDKSLLLSGGPYAAQTDVIDLGSSYSDKISYEAYVKITSSGSGGFVGFFEQVGGQAPQINCVYFNGYDGKVYFYSADQNHPVNVILAQNFSLGVWNKVHVDLDYQTLKANVSLNDVMIGDSVQISPKNVAYSGSSFTLRKAGMLHLSGSGIYFDDFSVQAVQ